MNKWFIDDDGVLQLNNSEVIEILNGNDDLTNIVINGNSQIKTIVIQSCPKLVFVKISDQSDIDTIQFETVGTIYQKIYIILENVKCNHFELHDVNAQIIKIKKCEFKYINVNLITSESLSINHYVKDIEFDHSKLNLLNLSNSIIKDIDILLCKINQLNIQDSCIQDLSIENCSIETFNHKTDEYHKVWFTDEQKKFRKSVNCYRIEFKNVEFNAQFNFTSMLAHHNWKTNLIKMDDVSFKGYSILRLDYDGKNLANCRIKTKINIGIINCPEGLNIQNEDDKGEFEIKIIYSTICEGILIINDLMLNKLTMKGFNAKLATSFKKCSFGEIIFDDFDNKNIVKFSNSKGIKKLAINNSDLNDVIFRPLNVADNNITISNDSFIGGMKIYGSSIIGLENSGLDLNGKQEFYRQLKQAAKNSNNKFAELEYKAKEFENYKPESKRDNMLLWVNSISSHGLDWFWPIIVMLLVNFLFWIPFTTNLYTNDFGSFDLCYVCDTLGLLFKKYLPSYFILLNPVSRLSEFNSFIPYPNQSSSSVSWLVGMIFLFSKVVNSIFIYQIVGAFRKFVSKD